MREHFKTIHFEEVNEVRLLPKVNTANYLQYRMIKKFICINSLIYKFKEFTEFRLLA